MDYDLWTQPFCLGCDKQTDGEAYCSESCKLAEFEKNSSAPSSPRTTAPSYPWATRQPSTKFYLAPAYDFGNAQPYNTRPRFSQPPRVYSVSDARVLSPSSSHSSLCSMQSTSSSNAEINQISDKDRQELRDYAVSFDQVRLQRRRSH